MSLFQFLLGANRKDFGHFKMLKFELGLLCRWSRVLIRERWILRRSLWSCHNSCHSSFLHLSFQRCQIALKYLIRKLTFSLFLKQIFISFLQLTLKLHNHIILLAHHFLLVFTNASQGIYMSFVFLGLSGCFVKLFFILGMEIGESLIVVGKHHALRKRFPHYLERDGGVSGSCIFG